MAVTRDSRESSAASASDKLSSSSARSSRKPKDRGAKFNEKHALKYGLSICSRNNKDNSVEMVMCKFCVAFGKESASDAPRKRRATANIKYFRQPFRADHYLSHLEINHRTKWAEYEHSTMPEKEVFFVSNADPAALAPMAVELGSAAPFLAKSEASRDQEGSENEATATPADNGAEQPTAQTQAQAATHGSASHAEAPTPTVAAPAHQPRVQQVRLPVSEIEKDVVEVLVGELFFNAHEEAGVTKEQALEVFVRKSGTPNYEIVVKNQRLYDLAIKFVSNGASYRLASRLIHCTKEETKLAHYGGVSDVKVASYVRAVLASNLQRLAWMMRAAWTYSIATETVRNQATEYLDFRVRLWHNSGLRDFHLFVIPSYDRLPAPAILERLQQVLNILDPHWRSKLLGVTSHGCASTGRHGGLTGSQQGLATRLMGHVVKPNFYLVWSAVHELEVIAKNCVTSFCDKAFYEDLVLVVQTIRLHQQASHNGGFDELPDLPSAHASPRGFVKALMTTLKWLLAHRGTVTSLLEKQRPLNGSTQLTPLWWVGASVILRLVGEVAYFLNKLTSMDQHETTVLDLVQQLFKLSLIMNDVVGATHDQWQQNVTGQSSPAAPSTEPASASRGSFSLSYRSVQHFIAKEGGSVAVEMFDAVRGSIERTQIAKCVAEFALDLISSVAQIAHQGRHFCAETPGVVVTPPRVMPYEVYQMGKDDFLQLVQSQEERLRETFTAQDIRRIQNEYYFFVAAVETEPILSGILKTHSRDTDVSFAWSCVNSRFLLLQEFVGGLASAVPDATSGSLQSELLYLNWEKPDYLLTTVDFALEGILHARQKMRIEVVDVNHTRAAMRSATATQEETNGGRRPVMAIDTATPVGGPSAEDDDESMDAADHEEETGPAAAAVAVATHDARGKRAAPSGDGYTLV